MDVTLSVPRRRLLLLLLGLAAGLVILFGLGLTLAASNLTSPGAIATVATPPPHPSGSPWRLAAAPPLFRDAVTAAYLAPHRPRPGPAGPALAQSAAPPRATALVSYPIPPIAPARPAAPLTARPAAPAEEVYAQVNVSDNNVMGWYGPGVTVQFTVTDAGSNVKGGGSGTAKADGWLDGVGCGCDLVPGDRVHVTSSAGFDEWVEVAAISAQIHPATDRVTGLVSAPDLPGSVDVFIHSEARMIGTGLNAPVDASGAFTADFMGQFDLQRSDRADVWYVDDNGNRSGANFYLLRVGVSADHDWIGISTGPNAQVTVSVAGKASFQGQANADGMLYTNWTAGWTPGQPDIAPGDNVTVSAAGATATINPIGIITGALNEAENTVAGTVNAPGWSQTLRLACEVWVYNGPPSVWSTVNPAGGAYSCDFDDVGWDLKRGDMVGVRYVEPDGDWVAGIFQVPYARANVVWDGVDGWFGANAHVQYTVRDGAGNVKGGGSGTAKPDGWLDGVGCDCDIAPGDHIRVISDAGFDAELVAIDITAQVNLEADRVTGQMSGGVFPARGYANVCGDRRGCHHADFDIDSGGAFQFTVGDDFGIERGDEIHVWYIAPDGNHLGSTFFTVEVSRVDVMVNWHDISGYAPQGPVTITTATEERILPGGWFSAWLDNPLLPGDTVTVKAGQGLEPVVIEIPAPFIAEASSITETVWGQVDHLNHEPIAVSPDGMPEQWTETDNGGRFSAAFGDLPRGARGEVRYDSWNNGTYVSFHRWWQTPDLLLEVNYGQDWIETTYEPGHTIWLTVTNAAGQILATNTGTTGYVPWWGGRTGYSTMMGGWSPGQPDIAPGDWVYGSLDNGFTTSVRVGTIAGQADVTQNTVAGAITADWFDEPLEGWCGIWIDNGPSLNFTVDPHGGAYNCDFDAVGFQLRPGHQVGVYYSEPDGDRVVNAFQPLSARANYRWDALDGWFGANASVQVTVQDGSGNVKGYVSGTAKPDGWLDGIWTRCDMVPGDRVHVTSDTGFDAWLDLIEITGWLDPDNDLVGGHMAGVSNGEGNVQIYSEGRWAGWGTEVTTDEAGNFTADLAGRWDLQAGDRVDVYAYDANWNQVGTAFSALRIEANYTHDSIWGETVPNVPVAVEVVGKGTCQGQANGNGDFWIDTRACAAGGLDIAPGDHLIAQAAGYTAEINPVGTIEGTVDADANTVDGTITVAGLSGPLHVRCEVWVENGPRGIEFWADAAGGAYHCDFDDVGWDLKPHHTVAVKYAEPDSDQVSNAFMAVFARANSTGDWVDGWFGPGVTVGVAVASATGAPKCSMTSGTGGNGWMGATGVGCDIVPGDRVHVTSDAGFDATLVPIPIRAHLDPALDRVTGQMRDGVFPAEGYVGLCSPLGENCWTLPIAIAGDGAFAADFSGMADLEAGFWGDVWYTAPDGNQVGIDFDSLRLEANYAHEWVNGRTEPLANVQVTVVGKASVQIEADQNGFFTTDWGQWLPDRPHIAPGDAIVVNAAGFEKRIEPVGAIDGATDLLQNTVQGKIHAPFQRVLPVLCEVWAENGPPGIWLETEANGGGYYCDFDDVGWDLRAGQDVAVSYWEPDGDRILNIFYQHGVRVYLEPAEVSTSIGEIFTADVMVETEGQQVGAVELYLTFDPTRLQVVDGSGNPATQIAPDLGALNLVVLNRVANDAGTIRYDATRLGTAVSGTFRVATIRFRALAATPGTDVQFVPDTEVYYAGTPYLRQADGMHVVAQGVCLRGKVGDQGHTALGGLPITVWFYPPGSNTPIATQQATLDAGGNFTACGVNPGTYDVRVKGRHSLSNRRNNVSVASAGTTVDFCTLLEGDGSGDDRVLLVDFTILAATYNKQAGQPGFDSRADYNGDGKVSAADLSLLAANYNKSGPVACPVGGAAPGLALADLSGGRQGGQASTPLTGTVDLAFSPTSRLAGVGQVFTLDLMAVAGTQPLHGAQLYVAYDPAALQVVAAGGAAASSIEPDLTTLEITFANQVDSGVGLIRYDAGTLKDPPPAGTFRVATVRFKVIGSAASTQVTYVAPSDVYFSDWSLVGTLGSATIRQPQRVFLPLVTR